MLSQQAWVQLAGEGELSYCELRPLITEEKQRFNELSYAYISFIPKVYSSYIS